MRDIREIQSRTKCANKTCLDFVRLFQKHIGAEASADLPKTFQHCDATLKAEAGVECIELHGCIHCQRHVFTPEDHTHLCPKCGGERFDNDGEPNERVYYFPIKERLEKLMSVPRYAKMCQHEFTRPRNDDYVTDVYDTPCWKEFMGPVTYPNKRMALQFCVDAIPAFAAGTLSLKPAEFINLSLPAGKYYRNVLQIYLSLLLFHFICL